MMAPGLNDLSSTLPNLTVMYRPGCATLVNDFRTDTPVNFANHDKKQS
jgi:hypothetical protein